MEVILKKTKISLSILKQTLRATENDLKNSYTLGWCIYKGLKYIILYNEDDKHLSMYPLFKDVVFKHNHNSDNGKPFLADVSFSIGYLPISYCFENEKERDKFRMLLNVIKNRANEAGQFFI